MRRILLKLMLILLVALWGRQQVLANCHEPGMVLVPGGSYLPFYKSTTKKNEPVKVAPFFMDEFPVTNAEYRAFLKENPQWSKKQIKTVFADAHYLQNLSKPQVAPSLLEAPVTFVSWFSAKAYCESKGKSLPSTDQWEYAAYDEGRMESQIKEKVLEWYSHPSSKNLPPVKTSTKNGFGVHGLLGLIWEWTSDFNAPNGEGSTEFCGGGGASTDPSNYVNYMRFAFRQSLKAQYTTANLGFRCVKSVSAPEKKSVTDSSHATTDSIYNLSVQWTTQDKTSLSLDSFKGHPVVMTMIYTQCKGACPLLVSDMKRIENALSGRLREETRFVLVSFDHEADTPETLLRYARAQGVDLKKWTLLNGSEAAVRNLSALLDVKYKKVGQGDFQHSNVITILDLRGKIIFQQEGLSKDPAESVKALTSTLRQAP